MATGRTPGVALARSLALVAIVIGRLMFMLREGGAKRRTLIQEGLNDPRYIAVAHCATHAWRVAIMPRHSALSPGRSVEGQVSNDGRFDHQRPHPKHDVRRRRKPVLQKHAGISLINARRSAFTVGAVLMTGMASSDWSTTRSLRSRCCAWGASPTRTFR